MNKVMPILRVLLGNIVTVVSILVIVGCLVWIILLRVGREGALADLERVGGKASDLRSFRQSPVTLPPEEADGPLRRVEVTVNEATINEVGAALESMSGSFQTILDQIVNENRNRHQPMLERLLPDPASEAVMFDARSAYASSFPAMFRPYAAVAGLPRLNAGQPPSQDVISDAIRNAQDQFLSNRAYTDVNALPPSLREELENIKRRALITELQRWAERIHIYAVTDPDRNDFPITIAAWADQQTRPSMEQIWEGQMQLWVVQDILQVIANVNRTSSEQRSVLESPVKRLLDIEVSPHYVGLNGAGMLGGPGQSHLASADPAAALPYDFRVAPTGRASNPLYDVRHARVRMHVDWHRLPEFFNELSRINFMTVLEMDVRDIDEYEMLRNRYLYGFGDVVEVDMVIESLWFREWTEQLMPVETKARLGLVEVDPETPIREFDEGGALITDDFLRGGGEEP